MDRMVLENPKAMERNVMVSECVALFVGDVHVPHISRSAKLSSLSVQPMLVNSSFDVDTEGIRFYDKYVLKSSCQGLCVMGVHSFTILI